MSVLTRFYARPTTGDEPSTESKISEPEHASFSIDETIASTNPEVIDTSEMSGRPLNDTHPQETGFQDHDVTAYFDALDLLQNAFNEVYSRLKASEEARVNSSADYLQQSNVIHRLEDEVASARRECEAANNRASEDAALLEREVARSTGLEAQIGNLERALSEMAASNQRMEAVCKRMHQGLLEVFGQETPISKMVDALRSS